MQSPAWWLQLVTGCEPQIHIIVAAARGWLIVYKCTSWSRPGITMQDVMQDAMYDTMHAAKHVTQDAD